MGSRPQQLRQAILSVQNQSFVTTDIVVVGNGWKPEKLPAGVKTVHLEENLGIPAGRNAGVPHVTGEYLLFVDDDAELSDPLFIHQCVQKFQENDQLGLLQPRITDPSGKQTPSRWIPRIRKHSAEYSSFVFSVLEAVVMIPRLVFTEIGGWGDPYFYAHEGIELAWRVWNSGKQVWYAGDLVVHHEATSPTRHAEYYRLNARNRVWLAKRNLPWPLILPYVLTWTGVQLIRALRTRGQGLGTWFSGWFQGWRVSPGGRAAMTWKSVWRMTRHGRFPVI